MVMVSFLSSDIILIGGLLLCGLATLLLVVFILRDFAQELRYINMEIQRTVGEERIYWTKRRRKLWLSLLPFYKE